jgi:hypothetical protein
VGQEKMKQLKPKRPGKKKPKSFERPNLPMRASIDFVNGDVVIRLPQSSPKTPEILAKFLKVLGLKPKRGRRATDDEQFNRRAVQLYQANPRKPHWSEMAETLRAEFPQRHNSTSHTITGESVRKLVEKLTSRATQTPE